MIHKLCYPVEKGRKKKKKICYPVKKCKCQSPGDSNTAPVVVRVSFVPPAQVVKCVLEPESFAYDIYVDPSTHIFIHPKEGR